MEIIKQSVNIGKAVYQGDFKTGAEGSIIVPDVKPDILKVLQVDAETFITDKQIENGKITVSGKVKVTVLYVPESEDTPIESINGCFDFCETMRHSEFSEDVRIIAAADAERVSYRPINSRKVGIEAQICISVQAVADKKYSFVTGIEDSAAEVKTEEISFCSTEECRDFCFDINEDMEIPEIKNPPVEILRSNVVIFEKEYRALHSKLVVKGKANAYILYLSENNCIEQMDFEVPFTEVFDIESLLEEQECEVSFEVCDCSFCLTGEANRIVRMNAGVRVIVKVDSQQSVEMLTDCYFTNADAMLERETYELERVIAKPSFSTVMKEIIQHDKKLPDIQSIYSVVAKPYVSSTQIQNEKITVIGKTVIYVLYTTANKQIPVCSINEEIPFSYVLDCEGAKSTAEVLLNVECEHISYTINSAENIEVRCGLGIKGRVSERYKSEVITEIEQQTISDTGSGIIIYFAKENDTLWDVAKRYHVKEEQIAACNEIPDSGKLICGEKLIIPVVSCRKC